MSKCALFFHICNTNIPQYEGQEDVRQVTQDNTSDNQFYELYDGNKTNSQRQFIDAITMLKNKRHALDLFNYFYCDSTLTWVVHTHNFLHDVEEELRVGGAGEG